jgi:hypothetical protein
MIMRCVRGDKIWIHGGMATYGNVEGKIFQIEISKPREKKSEP